MDVGWPPPAEGQRAKKEWGAVGGKGEAAAWGGRPSEPGPSITTASVDLTRSVPHFVPIDVGMWSEHVPGPYERYVKPVIDRLGALVLVVAVAPMILAASLAILVTMGRPVFLRQYRVGRHGKVFPLYKFRTMTPDRRRSQVDFDGPERRRTHKHPEDPRITPVGAFLRKWSLDEIPQFWNVVKGDMSLVGPVPSSSTSSPATRNGSTAGMPSSRASPAPGRCPSEETPLSTRRPRSTSTTSTGSRSPSTFGCC
jgi:lipopolysaccharide/colanic/teichoic acid biosynthesis glycosyltransferase